MFSCKLVKVEHVDQNHVQLQKKKIKIMSKKSTLRPGTIT